MENHDFKTAAAKLLAQHSVNAEKIVPKALVNQREEAVSKPVRLLVQETKIESHPIRPEIDQEHIGLPVWEAQESTEEKDIVYENKWKLPKKSMKATIMLGLIVFFSAIMVFILPPTKFGIVGNILLGILAGSGFGFIINREL